jgi:gliding motility-associated lipoprotein GldH
MLFIISCGENITYTDSYSIKDKTWCVADVKSFDAQINDTIASNDIFFTIRTGADYPFRNIFLLVSTSAPDGKNHTDTLEYFIADDKGNRYGKGFGDVRELKLPYKSNIFFSTKGEYKFNVRHGMRTENLKGVYDIGLRIEKTEK